MQDGLQGSVWLAGVAATDRPRHMARAWYGGGGKQPAEEVLGPGWSIVTKGAQHQAGRSNTPYPYGRHILLHLICMCRQSKCCIHAVLHHCQHLLWCECVPNNEMPLLQGEQAGGEAKATSIPVDPAP